MARIKHKVTGRIFDIESNELDWEQSADEEGMGPEICHDAALEHSELGGLVWSVWEYPAGVENHRETNVNGHEIISNFEYGLEHEEEPNL
jgi:hypothetical protein